MEIFLNERVFFDRRVDDLFGDVSFGRGHALGLVDFSLQAGAHQVQLELGELLLVGLVFLSEALLFFWLEIDAALRDALRQAVLSRHQVLLQPLILLGLDIELSLLVGLFGFDHFLQIGILDSIDQKPNLLGVIAGEREGEDFRASQEIRLEFAFQPENDLLAFFFFSGRILIFQGGHGGPGLWVLLQQFLARFVIVIESGPEHEAAAHQFRLRLTIDAEIALVFDGGRKGDPLRSRRDADQPISTIKGLGSGQPVPGGGGGDKSG